MKRPSRPWPRLVLCVLLAIALYLLLRQTERQSLYHPSAAITRTPQNVKLGFDNVVLTTSDHINIQGWFIPWRTAGAGDSDVPAIGTLLYLHGRAGNMGDCFEKIHLFNEIGLDIFIIDYRGFGKSGGSPTERGLTKDARAAYHYLTDKRGVNPERLFLYGEDLGAAVAINLAVNAPAAGLITEGAVASVIEKVQSQWPLIPWEYILVNQYRSIRQISEVRMPVLLIHSADDEVVPVRESRRLYSLANEPKELVEIEGPHRDAFIQSFETYYDKISGFVHNPASIGATTKKLTTP